MSPILCSVRSIVSMDGGNQGASGPDIATAEKTVTDRGRRGRLDSAMYPANGCTVSDAPNQHSSQLIRGHLSRTTIPAASHFKVTQIFGYSESVIVEATIDPVSLQGDGARKKLFKAAMAEVVARETDRIFTGDVKVGITWYISEERRYSTHIVADLDNIVKPLFDAITGPGGILIDDNQVQQFGASWTDAAPGDLKFTVEISATSPNQFIRRAALEFFEFDHHGCLPVPAESPEFQLQVINTVARGLRLRRALLDRGIDPFVASMHLPRQRFFPRARLGGYTVKPLPSGVTIEPAPHEIPLH